MTLKSGITFTNLLAIILWPGVLCHEGDLHFLALLFLANASPPLRMIVRRIVNNFPVFFMRKNYDKSKQNHEIKLEAIERRY